MMLSMPHSDLQQVDGTETKGLSQILTHVSDATAEDSSGQTHFMLTLPQISMSLRRKTLRSLDLRTCPFSPYTVSMSTSHSTSCLWSEFNSWRGRGEEVKIQKSEYDLIGEKGHRVYMFIYVTLLRFLSPMLRASCWISTTWSAMRFCSLSFSARVSSSVRASCRGRRSGWAGGVFFSMSWEVYLGLREAEWHVLLYT